MKKNVLCLKKYYKNERNLCFGNIFNKLPHDVCLLNMHILIYWCARCNCKLWNTAFLYFHTLFMILIHVWIVKASPNFHRLCAWLIYTFWYVNMPNVTEDYGRLSDLISVFWEFFIYFNMFETVLLHQTITSCMLRQKCGNEK